MFELIFVFFALVVVGGALVMAATRNIVYAAFALFAVLFGVAAVFALAGADFAAVSQIIVYVGGVLILMLFGVMLTHRTQLQNPATTDVILQIPAFLASGALLFALLYAFRDVNFEFKGTPAVQNSVKEIGVSFMTRYLLPFEMVSVFLLAALIGAAFISRKTKRGKEEQAG